jgi:hypothetical protein
MWWRKNSGKQRENGAWLAVIWSGSQAARLDFCREHDLDG